MLKELHIENFAVIEQMHISFGNGLTVLTGETGAGKSIIIDALNLLLGQRGGKELVRTGEKSAHVSAVFFCLPKSVVEKLGALGVACENEELLVSREIMADGRSQTRMSGRPATLSMLREIGVLMLTIHGQHDNQALLQSAKHIEILDAYDPRIGLLLAEYSEHYQRFLACKQDCTKLREQQQLKQNNIEILRYQLEEIQQVAPVIGEDDTLEQQLQLMRSADKIYQTLSLVVQLLIGQEETTGALDALRKSGVLFDGIAKMHGEVDAMHTALLEAQYTVEEVSGQLDQFLEQLAFSPEQLEQAEKRLHDLNGLKKKYGNTLASVVNYGQQVEKELDALFTAEEQGAELQATLAQTKQEVKSTGQALSEARRQAANHFVEQVSTQLRFLDMPNMTMQVQIEQTKYGKRGCDGVELLFSTNQGEELRSISKVASGGELSRLMLAIKSVVAKNDAIDTLIFDEIDVGVSGQSSQKIGLKLKQVAAGKQVLCVTHSAQIAALADHHLFIGKQTEDGRTYTSMTALDKEARVLEVARIMGTGKPTTLLLQHAEEMVNAGIESQG